MRKASLSMAFGGKTLEHIINNELIIAAKAIPLGDKERLAFDGSLIAAAFQ